MEVNLRIERRETVEITATVFGVPTDEAESNVISRVISEYQSHFDDVGYSIESDPTAVRLEDQGARVTLRLSKPLDTRTIVC